jgi:hypothetical protein
LATKFGMFALSNFSSQPRRTSRCAIQSVSVTTSQPVSWPPLSASLIPPKKVSLSSTISW